MRTIFIKPFNAQNERKNIYIKRFYQFLDYLITQNNFDNIFVLKFLNSVLNDLHLWFPNFSKHVHIRSLKLCLKKQSLKAVNTTLNKQYFLIHKLIFLWFNDISRKFVKNYKKQLFKIKQMYYKPILIIFSPIKVCVHSKISSIHTLRNTKFKFKTNLQNQNTFNHIYQEWATS